MKKIFAVAALLILTGSTFAHSRRDKKNVPVIFRCGEGRDSVTRVWSVEFPSPVKSKGYKTANLREAFWFEYWKQELKK